MDFTFTEDQLLFQDSVRDFLVNEVTPEKIRGLWETETGRCDNLYGQLAELGLTGMTVPEEFGGLGMTELDFILLARECGYVALPEGIVNTVLVAAPIIAAHGSDELKAAWLEKIATGEAKVAVGLESNLVVEDAHIADLLILEKDGAIYAVTQDKVSTSFNESVDRSRRLFTVDFNVADAAVIAQGADAEKVRTDIMNRGALGCAAQALGLAQRMIDISVQYTADRQQFGVAIGTFQAVKHHMANIAYKLEYAKSPVTRAAYSMTHGHADVATHVSHAKIVATEAADIAAKNCIQVHGAMGYTWEVDLHIFMKKAWAFNSTWGDVAYHKQRVADFVLADGAAIGAGATF